MATQTTQVKVTLSKEMYDYVYSKARSFGLPVSGYIKHLVFDEIKTMNIPEFRASEKAEIAYKEAKEDEEKGRTISVTADSL